MKRRAKRLLGRLFRSALAVLLVLLMILPAVGCVAGKKEPQLPETTAAETPTEEPTTEEEKQMTAQERVDLLLGKDQSFHANTFWQPGWMSSWYEMDVRIENGQLYLNDVLYDQVSYDPDYKTDFNENYRFGANEDVQKTLDMIESQEGYYVAQTSSQVRNAFPVAICFIDDNCYIMIKSMSRVLSGKVNQGE